MFLIIQKRRQKKNTTAQVNPETDINKDTKIDLVNLDDCKFQVKIRNSSEHSNNIEDESSIEKEKDDIQIIDYENLSIREVNDATKD